MHEEERLLPTLSLRVGVCNCLSPPKLNLALLLYTYDGRERWSQGGTHFVPQLNLGDRLVDTPYLLAASVHKYVSYGTRAHARMDKLPTRLLY